ncbi:MAG: hypothetical protein CVU05_15915, partial [Bacteroidetes bacterium HGW-Bacteroidetes-21]
FQETEKVLAKLKKPRNRYINEALQYYNRLQSKRLIEKKLSYESHIVSEESLRVLNDFENLDDYAD